jgi:hypothetical protein
MSHLSTMIGTFYLVVVVRSVNDILIECIPAGLSAADAEKHVSTLVTNGTIFARMDRYV